MLLALLVLLSCTPLLLIPRSFTALTPVLPRGPLHYSLPSRIYFPSLSCSLPLSSVSSCTHLPNSLPTRCHFPSLPSPLFPLLLIFFLHFQPVPTIHFSLLALLPLPLLSPCLPSSSFLLLRFVFFTLSILILFLLYHLRLSSSLSSLPFRLVSTFHSISFPPSLFCCPSPSLASTSFHLVYILHPSFLPLSRLVFLCSPFLTLSIASFFLSSSQSLSPRPHLSLSPSLSPAPSPHLFRSQSLLAARVRTFTCCTRL